MRLTSDYTGRLVDVLVFRGVQPTGVTLTTEDWLGGGGQVCTGILKLCQWALAEFFTEAGSVRFDATRGVPFLTLLRNGQLRTETDVFIAFGFAVGEIKALARTIETDATPADEQFDTWVLDRVVLSPGTCALYTTISSAAGIARPVILPIPV